MDQGKRLSILSLPEAKALYSVPKFDEREREHFLSYTEDELEAVSQLHSHRNRIHTLLMLSYFKVKPVHLVYDWRDIEDDYRYISQHYFPTASKRQFNIDRFTRRRLYEKVEALQEYQRYDNGVENELLEHLQVRARTYVDEEQLFRDTILFLKSKQVAIPSYSRLQKLISKVTTTEEVRLTRIIKKHLNKPDQLLMLIEKRGREMTLTQLKKRPKSHAAKEIDKELQRHEALANLHKPVSKLIPKLKLSQGNIQYYAQRCRQHNIAELRRFKQEKALLFLVCFIQERFKMANDILAKSFLVAYQQYVDQAVEYRNEHYQAQLNELSDNINLVPELIKLFIDSSIGDDVRFGEVRRRAFRIISKLNMPKVCQQLSDIKPDKSLFFWHYIDQKNWDIINRLRPIFLSLDFGCRDNDVLQSLIAKAKRQIQQHGKLNKLDNRLLLRGDKRHIKEPAHGDPKITIKPERRNEYYLYKLVHRGLEHGDVYVKNSLEYQSFDDYLVGQKIWIKKSKHLSEAGLGWMNQDVSIILDALKTQLETRIHEVGNRILEGKNGYIGKRQRSDKIKWSRAVSAKNIKLTERFFSHFDTQTIVQVLRKVNHETQFMQQLKPKSSRHKKATNELEHLLACVIGNGTFQGSYKFSSLSDQQYKILKRIETDCFYPEALQAANDQITSSAMKLAIYDDLQIDTEEQHGSADGQHYESKYHNYYVDYNAKHFRQKKKGSISYTLVSSFFALNGKVVPSRSHESHYLFDLVYNNSSEIQPSIIATDTHGTNQFNHAILHAFGYQFSPRYAQFKRKFLAEFNVSFEHETVLEMSAEINWKLIESEWDNIVKIMLSLGMRAADQATIVKKLCSFKQHNRTLKALVEYNRLFQCLHLLDYADDQQLRQVIQECLNRGESLHSLKRALASVGGGKFRGTDPEDMQLFNSCANLLANCIIYYNAMIMSSFKTHCLESGQAHQLRHLQSVSPASWENITLNGHYDLSENDEDWEIESQFEALDLAA